MRPIEHRPPRVLALALALSGACKQPAEEPASSEPVDATPPAPPPCIDAPSRDVLTLFSGSVCPWALVDHGDRVELVDTQRSPAPAVAAPAPEPCGQRTCAWEGHDTALGPVLLAVVPSPESEMPDGVWLGAVTGGRLVFVDLWDGAGEGVLGDGTPLGPAFALAPFDCGGQLGLVARPRLDVSIDEGPPRSLRLREATLEGSAIVRDRCTALAVPLP